MDFNCSGDLCGVAHTAADTGGEFVASYQTNLTFANPWGWYVPTQDLIEIYKMRCVAMVGGAFVMTGIGFTIVGRASGAVFPPSHPSSLAWLRLDG